MYEEGRGCTSNVEYAAECFSEAASLNHADGHFNLAQLLLMGEGVPQNVDKVVHHLTQVGLRLVLLSYVVSCSSPGD